MFVDISKVLVDSVAFGRSGQRLGGLIPNVFLESVKDGQSQRVGGFRRPRLIVVHRKTEFVVVKTVTDQFFVLRFAVDNRRIDRRFEGVRNRRVAARVVLFIQNGFCGGNVRNGRRRVFYAEFVQIRFAVGKHKPPRGVRDRSARRGRGAEPPSQPERKRVLTDLQLRALLFADIDRAVFAVGSAPISMALAERRLPDRIYACGNVRDRRLRTVKRPIADNFHRVAFGQKNTGERNVVASGFGDIVLRHRRVARKGIHVLRTVRAEKIVGYIFSCRRKIKGFGEVIFGRFRPLEIELFIFRAVQPRKIPLIRLIRRRAARRRQRIR